MTAAAVLMDTVQMMHTETVPARPGAAAPVLRPYQVDAVQSVFTWCAQNDGHPLVVIPTGGGKSLVMGHVIRQAIENYPPCRVLILAHRKELIQQNVRAVVTVMPLAAVGVYSAGLKRKDIDAAIIVGGIQSVAVDPYKLEAFDIILVDEAHLVPPDDDTMYRRTIEAAFKLNPAVRFVGLTATPFRMGAGLLHRGPRAFFTDIAYEAPVRPLIEAGYLCPLISRATLARLSTEGVAVRGGEYVPGALERAVDVDDLTQRVADECLALCAGRQKLLMFCAGVAHAEHVAAAFAARGCPAAAVHGELGAEDRAARLADFRAGRLRVLTSVDVLTTGYDEPSIDAVILMRPTKSTGLYIQQVGRGFRLHPGKQNTLILDFAGNVAAHGPVDEITVESAAKASTGEGTAPTKECPGCMGILFASRRVCPYCGHEFPPPVRPPILPEASMAPVLSTEVGAVTWEEVDNVQYARHEPREEGKRPTLRVEYWRGYRRIASEWICIEHDGYARAKAERWWRRRSAAPCPRSVDEAADVGADNGLLAPVAIATQPEGKWTRVADYRFAEGALPVASVAAPTAPATLPRACWSCGHWSGDWKTCLRYEEQPDAEMQKVGCAEWTEDVELPF